MKSLSLKIILKSTLPCMLLLTFFSASHARPSAADPVPTIQINGAVAKPTVWTNAQLSRGSAGPVVSVSYKLKGVPHVSHCVSLLGIIQAAQPTFNSHIKHHDLQFIVAVQGFDGYTVDFSMAELLPEFGNHPVWIAVDQDNKPLPDESEPGELVAPDDVKPGRWIYGIRTITIVDGSKI